MGGRRGVVEGNMGVQAFSSYRGVNKYLLKSTDQ